MLELSPRRTANPQAPRAAGNQQSRRLLLALGILLAALAAILIKDRQFWFGSEPSTIEADVPAAATAQPTAKSTTTTPAPSAHVAKKQIAAAPSVESKPADAPAVAATRTILPPLDVEVVAGDAHKKLHPGSNSTKLEIMNSAAAPSAPAIPAATNAAEREPMADAQPTYPILAQHMNVQGSVVLQALIGTDGVVENLRVLSGPAILASAAQQAVREWRFKPILQNGQAVESKATITVNFTIKVADSSAKTTLAESRAADSLIITR